MSTDYTCGWFALCDRPAVGVAEHPVLEFVPVCDRCAERMGLHVYTWDQVEVLP